MNEEERGMAVNKSQFRSLSPLYLKDEIYTNLENEDRKQGTNYDAPEDVLILSFGS